MTNATTASTQERLPTSNHHPTDLVSVLLEVERPSSAELAPYSRGERYRRLRANTEAHRTELQHWIDRHNLSDEVKTVSPATGFNLLFVQCTQHAAQELANAPGVIEVLSADE